MQLFFSLIGKILPSITAHLLSFLKQTESTSHKKDIHECSETFCKRRLNQIHKKFINQRLFSLLASLLLPSNGIYDKQSQDFFRFQE